MHALTVPISLASGKKTWGQKAPDAGIRLELRVKTESTSKLSNFSF